MLESSDDETEDLQCSYYLETEVLEFVNIV